MPPNAESSYVVGIIHYRDPDAVGRLLTSIGAWSQLPTEVIIADNSSDLPAAVLLASPASVKCRVIDMHDNLGYSTAANRLIHELDGSDRENFLLLTQDAELEPSAAEAMLAAFHGESAVAIAVPLLLFASQRDRIFSAGGILTKYGRTLHDRQGQPFKRSEWAHRRPFDVSWGDGACMMMRLRDVRCVGLFDENYFLYVEEVDLHLRVRLDGKQVRLVPSAVAYQEPGPYSLYYKYRNLPRFTRKFRDTLRSWPWALAYPKDSLRMLRQGRLSEPFWALRGLIDGRGTARGARPKSVFACGGVATHRGQSKPLSVVVESDPSISPPGVARRYGHITKWLQDNNVPFRKVALLSEDEMRLGKASRFGRAVNARSKIIAETGETDRVLFLGLGAVHMLITAAYCSTKGRNVYYDACDSWLLQLKARLDRKSLRLVIPALLGTLVQALTSRKIASLYISPRDMDADRILNWGSRRVSVIPISTPDELDEVKAFENGVPRQLVVSADYSAFQNADGIAMLFDSWPVVSDNFPEVVLRLFGPGRIELPMPVGAIRHMWAQSLADIYSGNSLILITNVGGSGVPNKVAEAVRAQRPLVIHESLRSLVRPHPWLHFYSSRHDLGTVLSSALSQNYVADAASPLQLEIVKGTINANFFS